jgi:Fe2+ transport system protein FeoA
MSSPSAKFTLDQLESGQTALVKGVLAHGPVGQRLSEMGLVEGTRVRLVRRAPLGGPLAIEVQDYLLSLRRTEAALISVAISL